MAPSHMEIDSPEYTHKKFNYCYSHTKLGMVRRGSQEERQQEKEIFNISVTDINGSERSATASPIFRPYALDEAESPKKRKISKEENEIQMAPHNGSAVAVETSSDLPDLQYYSQHFSQQQSADAYAQKLQRQRAALYMKHIMQYYENGNGWPTMHPNVFSNNASSAAYQNVHQC